MKTLLLGTGTGCFSMSLENGQWKEAARALPGVEVTALALQRGAILAGTRKGVFRSEDRGQTWLEANSDHSPRYVRWLTSHPSQSRLVFCGTEPASIYLSQDGGLTWTDCPEVAQQRDRHGWWLPYSSGAGCVRGFAFHGPRGYAAVEVGGMLVSENYGQTWRLASGSDGKPQFGKTKTGMIHPDVHSVAVHPSSPDLVFAPTGGGLYRSRDGGATWELLYECYCRAAWLDPGDPDHLLFGPADDVDRNGRIEETRDGGRTWTPAVTGLKVEAERAVWKRGMVERFIAGDADLFAITSQGGLLRAPLSSLVWEEVLPASQGVRCGAILETGS